MTPNIIFDCNTASIAQLSDHLRSCDEDFAPALSERVSISAYAEKLFHHAARFEAWESGILVGLVAAYLNDPQNKSAFISSVSVLEAWRGFGIAGKLLDRCVQRARDGKYSEVRLAVSASASGAVVMYERRGFTVLTENSSMLSMLLPL